MERDHQGLENAQIEPEDYPTEYFRPRASQTFGAIGMIVVGFVVTLGVSRLGGSKER